MSAALVVRVLVILSAGAAADNWLDEGRRPLPENRKFVSAVVDRYIQEMAPQFISANVSRLFGNCLPNTLDTTIEHHNPQLLDTFVVTGDIHAMWLRDSTNQVLPYLHFAAQDKKLRNMICGVIRRQARLVLVDPYSNAFNFNASGEGNQDDVSLRAGGSPVRWCSKGMIYESKYELDSLAAVLKLSRSYFEATADLGCFTDDGFAATWISSVELILQTIQAQQRGTADELQNVADPADFSAPAYTFQRTTQQATDTLMQGGKGVPARACGLSKTYFRPSDDAVTMPFLVPANAMAIVEWRRIVPLVRNMSRSAAGSFGERLDTLEAQAQLLVASLEQGMRAAAVVPVDKATGSVYAYEVDGFGSSYMMDDANIPSLLSLPYLGYVGRQDPVYLATRKLVLSERNPFYFKGSAAEGVGGPHQGYGMVWPMGVMIRALTSDDDGEILHCLEMLVNMSDHKGFMHESVNMFNVTKYTRGWFAWANSLFGELILTLIHERPHLVLRPSEPRPL